MGVRYGMEILLFWITAVGGAKRDLRHRVVKCWMVLVRVGVSSGRGVAS